MTSPATRVVVDQFAQNLRRERKRADLSQEQVAIRASVHRTEISNLERALRVARIDTLAKLAGALEISPGCLLDGIAWEPGEYTRGGFRPELLSETGG
jgi:transcriptional regulator with XRE-family HTH domain